MCREFACFTLIAALLAGCAPSTRLSEPSLLHGNCYSSHLEPYSGDRSRWHPYPKSENLPIRPFLILQIPIPLSLNLPQRYGIKPEAILANTRVRTQKGIHGDFAIMETSDGIPLLMATKKHRESLVMGKSRFK